MKFEGFFRSFWDFNALLFAQATSELRQTYVFHITFLCTFYHYPHSGCHVRVTEKTAFTFKKKKNILERVPCQAVRNLHHEVLVLLGQEEQSSVTWGQAVASDVPVGC